MVAGLSTKIGNRFDWLVIIIDVDSVFDLFDFDGSTHWDVGCTDLVSLETNGNVAPDF